jgi:pimeloyl-ACP methyl ester carboxylesterase
MQIYRTYGKPPLTVAVIHGGPGTIGEMEPVARDLSADLGVLEPIQTETTLEGQIEELKITLEEQASPPVTLIGFSWGAWLSYIFTARYPALVKKLILVGSGPYEQQYVSFSFR